MKKGVKIAVTAIVCVSLLAALLTGCVGGDKKEELSYVSIDVNPSIELILDEDDRVLSAYGANDDARVLLYGEELEGKSAQEAIVRISRLCVEAGHVSDENGGVNVTVTSSVSEKKENSLIETAKAEFTAAANEKGISVRLHTDGGFSLNRKLERLKAEHSGDARYEELTVGRLKLILAAQEADGTLTIEAAIEADTSDLMAKLDAAYSEADSILTDAYAAVVKEAEKAYEITRATLIDSVYSEWYIKKYASLDFSHPIPYGCYYFAYSSLARSVDTVLDSAERFAESVNGALTDEQLAAIADKLGVALNELKSAVTDENGNITLDAVDEYIDDYLKNATEEEREALKGVVGELENYLNTIADSIENIAVTVAEEFAVQIRAAIEAARGIVALLPDSIAGGEYTKPFTDFANAVNDDAPSLESLRTLTAGLRANADKVMAAMKNDLSAEELAEIDAAIAERGSELQAAAERLKTETDAAVNAAREWLAERKHALNADK